jgi:hypothetical protein
MAEVAPLLAQREVAVQYDPIHAAVAPLQQIGRVVGERVMCFHALSLLHQGGGGSSSPSGEPLFPGGVREEVH